MLALTPQKEQINKAQNQYCAEQYNIYAAFCFRLAVVEKPQFSPIRPLARPFPSQQHPRQQKSNQNSAQQM